MNIDDAKHTYCNKLANNTYTDTDILIPAIRCYKNMNLFGNVFKVSKAPYISSSDLLPSAHLTELPFYAHSRHLGGRVAEPPGDMWRSLSQFEGLQSVGTRPSTNTELESSSAKHQAHARYSSIFHGFFKEDAHEIWTSSTGAATPFIRSEGLQTGPESDT